jgi:putative ABC transport system permease protein
MLRSYLTIAFKVLLRRKFFTFISLFGISFTLLVVMVAAAFLDHMFGAFPPETRTDRTLGIYHVRLSGPNWIHGGNPGYRFLDRYIRTLPSEGLDPHDGAAEGHHVQGR